MAHYRNSNNINIRPWQPGDEHAILALFQQSFGREMSLPFWRWRFQAHPSGPPLIMLAWQGEKLVAHYAASQAPLVVDGKERPAALSMTTMTHPDFRGMGLVERVGEALYDQMRKAGFVATWGFPNAMINATRRRKLNWTQIADVPAMTLALDGASPTARPSDIGKLAAIDERFEALAGRIADRQGRIRSSRSTAILKWRIDDNPVNSYARHALIDGDRLAGYAITKAFGADGIDILDLQAEEDDGAVALLQSVRADAVDQNRAFLALWCLPFDPLRVAVERFGFVARAPVTYFGGHALQDGWTGFDDPRHWTLAMLDSDLY